MCELMCRRGVPAVNSLDIKTILVGEIVNAAILELYVFPGLLRDEINDLGLKLGSSSPTYPVYMKRCRFALNLTNLTKEIKDEICSKLEDLWKKLCGTSAELNSKPNHIISLYCIGMGIGEVCRHCCLLCPTNFAHLDRCASHQTPKTYLVRTEGISKGRVRCTYCKANSEFEDSTGKKIEGWAKNHSHDSVGDFLNGDLPRVLEVNFAGTVHPSFHSLTFDENNGNITCVLNKLKAKQEDETQATRYDQDQAKLIEEDWKLRCYGFYRIYKPQIITNTEQIMQQLYMDFTLSG